MGNTSSTQDSITDEVRDEKKVEAMDDGNSKAATGSSLVWLFDKLTRNSRVLREGGCEEQFIQFAVSCLNYWAVRSDQKFSCHKNRPQ